MYIIYTGADPGFQVRGGAHLKFVWGISCEKSRFYAKKKHIFTNFRGGGGGGGAPGPIFLPKIFVYDEFCLCGAFLNLKEF